MGCIVNYDPPPGPDRDLQKFSKFHARDATSLVRKGIEACNSAGSHFHESPQLCNMTPHLGGVGICE